MTRIVSPFNPKAKKWVTGREGIFDRLSSIPRSENITWMHCSSLGEFEQGRPLIEKLRSHYPATKIVLTFFSPSGYEVQKNYAGADYVFYMPMDNASNARRFFDLVQPKLVLFIKYEFWFYYLDEARRRNIPTLLISGIFRKEQPFFKWYGSLHREMLGAFNQIFVQNTYSIELLKTIGVLQNVSLAGDTRFDRVIEIAEHFEPIKAIDKFCGDADVIVGGSTWDDDDEELDHYANTHPETRFIIAPHDIGKERLQDCKQLYTRSIFYSELAGEEIPPGINTLIIDNIGMLSRLYRYATICYVGGGFGDDGVHNVLEAAVYYKPVIFGPEYDKFFEAEELVECGGAFSIESALELEKTLDKLLLKGSDYISASEAAGGYVRSKKGSTDKIFRFIQENRLLTN